MKRRTEADRRLRVRHAIALPVEVSGAAGITLNVNSTGVLFECPVDAHAGEAIDFRMDLEPEASPALLIRCHGRVVRAIPTDRGTRVAATIESIENES